MRALLSMALMVLTLSIMAQNRYAGNPQALRITKNEKLEAARQDSLRKVYDGRWTLNVGFGNRFIDRGNLSERLDTISFADFTNLRGYLNLGAGKFLSRRFWLNMDLSLAVPKRNQEITSFSVGNNGVTIEGEGGGGLLFGLMFTGKYYFKEWANSRLYVGGAVGALNLVAKGGSVNFSATSGQDMSIEEARARYASSQISSGITLRPAKGWLFDVGLGYTFTSTDEPIGRIISPGGFNLSFTFSFVLNANK